MKFRMLRVLAGMTAAGALALAGGAWAQSVSVGASVSGSTLSVTGSASTSSLSSGTYSALVSVTNSSGSTVMSGSNSFTIGGSSGSMTLTTVDGRSGSGLSVTSTAPSVCGTFGNASDVILAYMATVSSSGTIGRYQIIQPTTGSSYSSTFCAPLVLDSGTNTIIAAYASLSGQLVVSNSLTVTNGSTSVNSGSARIQMTWNTATDIDLYLYSPVSSGGTATTSSYGSRIWYGGTSVSGFGSLDVDDTSGYGPENITTTAFPRTGRYLIAANAYSNGSARTSVTLTAYTGTGTTLNSQTFTFTATGQTYLMGYLNVSSTGSFTFESLGSFAGDGSGQMIEPPAGYVSPPKN